MSANPTIKRTGGGRFDPADRQEFLHLALGG